MYIYIYMIHTTHQTPHHTPHTTNHTPHHPTLHLGFVSGSSPRAGFRFESLLGYTRVLEPVFGMRLPGRHVLIRLCSALSFATFLFQVQFFCGVGVWGGVLGFGVEGFGASDDRWSTPLSVTPRACFWFDEGFLRFGV